MSTRRDVHTAWTTGRDETFFRIVQSLFPAMWLSAASVLLASYDEPDEPTAVAGAAAAPTAWHVLRFDSV